MLLSTRVPVSAMVLTLLPANPILGTGTPQSSHSSDCGGSDVDWDSTDSKLFPRGEALAADGYPVWCLFPAPPKALPHSCLTSPLSADGFPDCKKGEPKHGKRKRGRPRKLSKEYWECLEGKKNKHGEPRGELRGADGHSAPLL